MLLRLKERLTQGLLGAPLVSNAFRGTLVEAIIALAVEPVWVWKDGGWGGHDFNGPDGLRLEIKQSAARQSWHTPTCPVSSPRFDIKERTGFYDDAEQWQDAPGRRAHLYCFAWHPVEDATIADHRDPDQWTFYIVRTSDLPDNQKTIGIGGIKRLTDPVQFDGLLEQLNKVVGIART